jgi:hypothetical protein
VSSKDVELTVATMVPSRYTRYAWTPVLSVDGAQATSIRLALMAVADTAVGTDGAVVSEPALPFWVVADAELDWAEAVPARSSAPTVGAKPAVQPTPTASASVGRWLAALTSASRFRTHPVDADDGTHSQRRSRRSSQTTPPIRNPKVTRTPAA